MAAATLARLCRVQDLAWQRSSPVLDYLAQ
jgi:hypothetical protein